MFKQWNAIVRAYEDGQTAHRLETPPELMAALRQHSLPGADIGRFAEQRYRQYQMAAALKSKAVDRVVKTGLPARIGNTVFEIGYFRAICY